MAIFELVFSMPASILQMKVLFAPGIDILKQNNLSSGEYRFTWCFVISSLQGLLI
jgi:hypothetical protein